MTHRLLRRYAAALSERKVGARDGRPQARRPARVLRDPARARRDRRQPGRPAGCAQARTGPAATSWRPTRSAACWTASPPRRRWSCATARSSRSPTPAGCAPRSSSTLDLTSVDFDAEELRIEGKGSKTRFVPAGEPALQALARYLERARDGARAGPGRSRAVPLEDRPAPVDIGHPQAPAGVGEARRRAGRSPSARPASFLRDAPSGGRRGSAIDPGTAGSCLRVYDADLHSGRVGAPETCVRAGASKGLGVWKPTSNQSS